MKLIVEEKELLNGDKDEALIADGFEIYFNTGNMFDEYYTEKYVKQLLREGYAIVLQEYNYYLGDPESGSIYNIIWYKKI